MTQKKKYSQRRKLKRFRVKGGAHVVLNKPGFFKFANIHRLKLGPVIDISMGGLAVQYMESKDRQKELFELALSTSQNGICLDKVPFVTKADFKVTELEDSTVIRNRCIQFGALDSNQSFHLKNFIDEYALDQIRDRRSGKDRRIYDDRIKDNNRKGSDRRKFVLE